MRAALFITCLGDTLFPGTGRAVVEVLERLGHEVDFPEEQTCCGQMHANSGYQLEAVPLVRRFVDAFGDAEVVVSPSASCVGMVREQYADIARLGGDPGLEREVRALVPRVVELSEFIVDRLGLEDVGASFPHTVTYHPTCHSARLLHVGDRPLRLLSAVRGLELVDLPGLGRVLRLRRHVRGEERRHLGRDARGQAGRGHGHRGRGMRVGGQLVPHAHGRRAAPPRRARADDAPGRGAGGGRVTATGLPRRGAHRAGGPPAARATWGRATTTIRAKRAAVVAEVPDWEALRDAGAAIKARAMATLPEQLERLEARRHGGRGRGPLGPRRGRGQRHRHRHRARARARAR